MAPVTGPTNEHSEQCSKVVEMVQEPPVVVLRSDGATDLRNLSLLVGCPKGR
jgi:hypothetical protein